MREACVVQIPSIILTLETGTGSKPLPMLLLESGFEVNISNWSSQVDVFLKLFIIYTSFDLLQLSVDAILTLQMGYYNNRLALWEPLIEPVQITKDKKITYKPWELKLEVCKINLMNTWSQKFLLQILKNCLAHSINYMQYLHNQKIMCINILKTKQNKKIQLLKISLILC